MNDAPHLPASDRPRMNTRLVLAALGVAALASVAASLVVACLDETGRTGLSVPMAISRIESTAMLATVISFFFVLAALLLIAWPLTRAADRLGVGVPGRSLTLLGVGTGIGALLWLVLDRPLSGGDLGFGAVFAIYSVVAAIVWTLVVNRLERKVA